MTKPRARIPAMLLILALFQALLFSCPVSAQEDQLLTLSADPGSVFTTETCGITAKLATQDGQPVSGQEIVFSTDRGAINPDRAVTDSNGEARATFTAPGQAGMAQITASAGQISQTVQIEVLSTIQWICMSILTLLGMLGAVGATAFYLRRRRIPKQV